MSYTVPLQDRQIVIESCHADLHDISEATTIRTSGTAYLLVRFKPARSAACASGQRPAVALPTDDAKYINAVAAAINRTCCATAAVAAAPAPSTKPAPAAKPAPAVTPARSPLPAPASSPSPSSTQIPAASSTPAASPTPARAAVRDWVENDGLFWFVRMRNSGSAPIAPAGDVFDCVNVDIGCGPFARRVILPGATATIATIATTNHGMIPAFSYRYTVGEGADAAFGSGSSRKRAANGGARMSAQELRASQASALNEIASQRTSASPVLPARLIKRGSSRLAIGQTGTAVVRLMIAPDGTPQEAAIVSITNRQLTAAAIETAVSSTFAPATQNGRSVAAKYVATFSFDGQDPALTAIPLWKRSAPPAPASSPVAPAPQSAPSPQPSVPPPAAQSVPTQPSAPPAPSAATPGGGASPPPPTPPPIAEPSSAPSVAASAAPAIAPGTAPVAPPAPNASPTPAAH